MGRQAGCFEKFRAPDLHPLDVHAIIHMAEEVDVKGMDLLFERYLLHDPLLSLRVKSLQDIQPPALGLDDFRETSPGRPE